MANVYVSWGISAMVLILAAGWVGYSSGKHNILGIFVDSRGRFSLSQFQMVLWTILVLSLLSGFFIARLLNSVNSPLDITIPNELLIVMGISIGSATAAGAIKAGKDLKGVQVKRTTKASFSQTFTEEEGSDADNAVDITKFQNLWLTLIVIVAYTAAAINYIGANSTIAGLNTLPGFNGTLLTLLGISHAGYLAGKLPDKGKLPVG